MRARLARLEQPLRRLPERLANPGQVQRAAMLMDKLIWSMRQRSRLRRDALASRVGTLEAFSTRAVRALTRLRHRVPARPRGAAGPCTTR